MNIENQLEKFRIAFRFKNVRVEDTYMAYKTPRGFATSIAKDANEKIDELGLPLVAIATPFLADDSFIVKQDGIEL